MHVVVAMVDSAVRLAVRRVARVAARKQRMMNGKVFYVRPERAKRLLGDLALHVVIRIKQRLGHQSVRPRDVVRHTLPRANRFVCTPRHGNMIQYNL